MEYNKGRSWGRSWGGSFGGGWRGDSWRRDGGWRSELFRTTCAECGDSCEVPFRPSGDRPVYCSRCFKNVDNWGGRDFERNEYSRWGREDRGRRDSSDFWEKRMYKATCAQCGNDCELPFKPTSDRPVYCSDCFITDDKSKSRKNDDNKLEFERLNEKLDLIIKALAINEVKDDTKKEKVKIKLPKISKKDVVQDIDEEIDNSF